MSVLDYSALYDKYGKIYDIDPHLIAAVVTQESHGNPNASNASSGATGLMQVTAGTWGEIDRKASPPVTPGEQTNPDLNIQHGAAYLRMMTDNYGPDLTAILACYNGGPGTWENSGNNLANMPSETRSYVPAVLGYKASYDSGTAYENSSSTGSTAATRSTAAGTASADAKGILKFAAFAQSLAFTKSMVEGFESGMDYTLHSYLSNFMAKFYHNMYYVPTLPNNKAILVKPETLFVDPPSCNIIYPTLKSSISYSRSQKDEPTRLIMVSDPVTNIFGVPSTTATQLVTMSFIDETATTDSSGAVSYKQKVIGISAMGDKSKPMHNITSFEQRNGVRIMRAQTGEDLYLFLVSNQANSGGTTSTSSTQTNIIKTADPAGIGSTLAELAAYTLLRARYEQRNGGVQMYFNPYIVPGFPMLSVEGQDDSSLNIYGYVTDVTHNITDREWTTHVGFTAAHIETEPRPPNFPIAESEYAETLPTTYSRMLGAAVTPVTDPAACRTSYTSSDGSVSAMLKKIWRPLTTMLEHLTDICGGATIAQCDGYRMFKNGPNSKFFDESTQARIVAYTTAIMTGVAFYDTDSR